MTGDTIRLNAYGRHIEIQFVDGAWIASFRSSDGKRFRAPNLAIPADLDRDQVVTYIADLLHESATESNPNVVVLE